MEDRVDCDRRRPHWIRGKEWERSHEDWGGPVGRSPRFPLLSLADIEALPDLEWLVEGVLAMHALAILYGEPGCGKSFVALFMALANASGRPWLGRTTRQTKTLYIAAEGVLGLSKSPTSLSAGLRTSEQRDPLPRFTGRNEGSGTNRCVTRHPEEG